MMYKFKKNYDFPIVVKTKAYVKDEIVYSFHPFFNQEEFNGWKKAVKMMEAAEEKYNKKLGEVLFIKEYGMTEEGISQLEKDYEFFYSHQ